MLRECPTHGLTEYVQESDVQIRCKKCRVESVTKRREKVRFILVQEAGGKCVVCGYDRYVGALDFHHKDPTQKSFGLSERGLTRALETLRKEASKCVLLCATCHREVEAGITIVPE